MVAQKGSARAGPSRSCGSPAATSARCRAGASSAGPADAAQRRKRTVRRLFGTAKGRFRTRGRYSAAAVRGHDVAGLRPLRRDADRRALAASCASRTSGATGRSRCGRASATWRGRLARPAPRGQGRPPPLAFARNERRPPRLPDRQPERGRRPDGAPAARRRGGAARPRDRLPGRAHALDRARPRARALDARGGRADRGDGRRRAARRDRRRAARAPTACSRCCPAGAATTSRASSASGPTRSRPATCSPRAASSASTSPTSTAAPTSASPPRAWTPTPATSPTRRG